MDFFSDAMQLEFNDVHEHFVVDVVVLHCDISFLAITGFLIYRLNSLDTVVTRNAKATSLLTHELTSLLVCPSSEMLKYLSTIMYISAKHYK